jgi:hypothetical protein
MSRPIIDQHDVKPWYKEFWPWFIIALLGSVVTASLITVSIAFDQADDLVIDDYYKLGLAINQRIEERDNAERLGISAAIEIRGTRLYASLAHITRDSSPELILGHPFEADRDLKITLLPGPDETWFADFPEPVQVGWHWSISGRLPKPWLVSGRLEPKHFGDAAP